MFDAEAERYDLTVQDADALVAVMPEPWTMYVRLVAATGLRPEEAAGLQLRDVAPDCSAVTVRRVLIDARPQFYESKPKTPKSHRTLTLDSRTRGDLTAYLKRHRARATKWFTDHPDHAHPGDRLPLFVGVGVFKRGQRQRKAGSDLDWLGFSSPMSHRWFYMRHWKTALKKVGLSETIRFYDLRHAHISWLVARLGQPGALSITEISERAGHASPVMTLNRYAHSPSHDDDRHRKGLPRVRLTPDL